MGNRVQNEEPPPQQELPPDPEGWVERTRQAGADPTEINVARFKRFKFEQQYSLPGYFPSISHVSIPTSFISLTLEEGQVISRAFSKIHIHPGPQTPQDLAVLQNLEKKIQEKIEHTQEGQGVFIRLSRRSPKDVLSIIPSIKASSLTTLSGLLQNTQDQSQRYIAVFQSFMTSMKVTSGKMAVEMLINSSRVHSDILFSMDFPKAFDVQVCIRDWVPMTPESEFRGFVYERKLNALTQASDLLFFQDLAQNDEYRQKIQKAIFDCFEAFKDKLTFDHAVLDFLYLKDVDKAYIIELNSFQTSTGSILFDWCKDHDIIQKGPFEFRYLKDDTRNKHLAYLDKWIEEATTQK